MLKIVRTRFPKDWGKCGRYTGKRRGELPHIFRILERSHLDIIRRGKNKSDTLTGKLNSTNKKHNVTPSKLKRGYNSYKLTSGYLPEEFKAYVLIPADVTVDPTGLTEYALEGLWLENPSYQDSYDKYWFRVSSIGKSNLETDFWEDRSFEIPYENGYEIIKEIFPWEQQGEPEEYRKVLVLGLIGAPLLSTHNGFGWTITPTKKEEYSTILKLKKSLNKLIIPEILDKPNNPLNQIFVLDELRYPQPTLSKLYGRQLGYSETRWAQPLFIKDLQKDNINKAKEEYSELNLAIDCGSWSLPKIKKVSVNDLEVSSFWLSHKPISIKKNYEEMVLKAIKKTDKKISEKWAFSSPLTLPKANNIIESTLRFENKNTVTDSVINKAMKLAEDNSTQFMDRFGENTATLKEQVIAKKLGWDDYSVWSIMNSPITLTELQVRSGRSINELTPLVEKWCREGNAIRLGIGEYKIVVWVK